MKRLLCTLALLLAVPATANAQGYVRTMTCNIAGAINACEPGEVPKPIAWPNACITFYVNEQGADDVDGADEVSDPVLTAVTKGFYAWNGPETSRFIYEYAGKTDEDRAEWVPDRGDSGNANIVVWREDWPADFSRTAYAITSVSYNPESAKILDVDIELNSEFHEFSVSDDDVVVDIQNTVAHESGHFLGLDHSPERVATMYGTAPVGQTSKRDLASFDIEGVSVIYPADGTTDSCESSDGFFEKPPNDDGGCCATADGDARSPAPALLSLFFIAMWWVRRRQS